MNRLRFALLALVAVLAVGIVMPTGANAAAVYKFDIYDLNTPDYHYVHGLDATKVTTIRVVRGGLEQFRDDNAAGSTDEYFYTQLNPGDVVEVYQGAAYPANPPVTAPTDSFTVPNFTIAGAAGSPLATGAISDGWSVYVSRYPACSGPSDAVPAAAAAGAYTATFPMALGSGDQLNGTAVSTGGDRIQERTTVAGDAGCVYADAQTESNLFESTPYGISTWGLDPLVAPTTRMLLRRAGAILADDNNDSIGLPSSIMPAPGDVIEVYRPMGALSPAYSWTIPQISGRFDFGNELVAIDAPAAAEIGVYVCRPVVCGSSPDRGALNVPAGRTIFSYATPQARERAFDIHPDDVVGAWWYSPEYRDEYDFDVVPGDLTSPIGKITLARVLRLAKIGKKIKFKLNSNEAGRAVSTLTSTPNLPKAHRGGKKSSDAAKKRPVKLASASTVLVAGTRTISLKVTKTGKKTIKKMLAARKNQKATLTVTLTDASGNVTTVVKNTTLSAKKARKRKR